MSNNSKLILFIVESKNIRNSDSIYIMELMRDKFSHYLSVVTIDFVYMDSKYKYNKRKVINKIKSKTKYTKNFEIIYILDKDNFQLNPDDLNHVKEVTQHCRNNNYHLIWFVPDIENVLIGKSSNDKTKDAVRFKNNEEVKTLDFTKLVCKNPTSFGTSNFILVMEKILSKVKL